MNENTKIALRTGEPEYDRNFWDVVRGHSECQSALTMCVDRATEVPIHSRQPHKTSFPMH